MFGAYYATIFKTGQYGRLYIVSGRHARGRTFHIWVLPSDEPVVGGLHLVDDKVEVYGVTGGRPGWTETYGWLHHGPWQKDFYDLFERRRSAIKKAAEDHEKEQAAAEEAERQRVARLLATY